MIIHFNNSVFQNYAQNNTEVKITICKILYYKQLESERQDLNLRHPTPKAGAEVPSICMAAYINRRLPVLNRQPSKYGRIITQHKPAAAP